MSTTRAKGMYWVIGTLTVALLPQIAAMPLPLSLACLLPLGWRIAAERRRWKPPGTWVRVILTLFALLLLLASYGSLLGRRTAVSLLTLMLALKLLETFRVRDARIVASLSLFLCATQFLFSQNIPMVFYTGAVTVGSLVTLALLHRREAFEAAGDAPATGHSLFAELGFTLRLVALALPAAMAFFLLFPRWSSPLWGVPEEALDARSGLSNSMMPGSIQGLFMDDSPAFRADFEGAAPPHQLMYWRGPVLWDFDGREWTSSYYARGLQAEKRPAAASAPWRYRIQLEPHEQHWLFALDYPALIPDGARLTMDFQLYSRKSVTNLKSYAMASDPRFVDSPVLRSVFRRAALDLPPDFNPRTREMMQQWRRETPDDRRLVQRVLTHFNQQAFHYTLNPPLLSRHTVDEFLFETRSGFCEHYASAFTIMMRMAGIPARVVTGYQGGWFNPVAEYVLVRQSDAHAWAEVWLPEDGWTRVDPTAAVAPERIESGSLDALAGRRHWFDFTWVRGARNGFDLLQRRWNDWVIAFNADRQSRLLSPFGWERVEPAALVLLMLLTAAVVSALTLPAVLRMRHGRKTDPALRAWRRFRSRLMQAGVETYSGQAPMELAAAAGSRMGDEAAEAAHVAGLYARLRYSAAPPAADEFIRAARSFRPPRSKRSRT